MASKLIVNSAWFPDANFKNLGMSLSPEHIIAFPSLVKYKVICVYLRLSSSIGG
ncbi:MAG: hypothetical protein RMY34_12395 [Aulosira sp. DedQUE10]|nr:hypothetical protein [Aulosira sp. DedQUE10]